MAGAPVRLPGFRFQRMSREPEPVSQQAGFPVPCVRFEVIKVSTRFWWVSEWRKARWGLISVEEVEHRHFADDPSFRLLRTMWIWQTVCCPKFGLDIGQVGTWGRTATALRPTDAGIVGERKPEAADQVQAPRREGARVKLPPHRYVRSIRGTVPLCRVGWVLSSMHFIALIPGHAEKRTWMLAWTVCHG